MDNQEILKKFIIIGDSGVGKTVFLLSAVDKVFPESFLATIGIDFKTTTIEIGNVRVKLQIWDTAGQELQRVIKFLDELEPKLVQYLLTFPTKIHQNLFRIGSRRLRNMLLPLFGQQLQDPKQIFGTSSYQKLRIISTQDAQTAAQQFGFEYFECSAKDHTSTFEVLKQVATKLVEESTAAALEQSDDSDLGAQKKDKLVQQLAKLKTDQERLKEALELNQVEILKIEEQLELI